MVTRSKKSSSSIIGFNAKLWFAAANPRADTNLTQNLEIKANFAIGGYMIAYTASDL